MQRTVVHPVILAAALLAGCLAAAASEADCAFPSVDADALDRVQDCVRMGRHVRVGPSVSRGTATLGGGMVTTAGDRDVDGLHRRVRVPGAGIAPYGFFGQ